MQQTPGFSRRLFRAAATPTSEGQAPAMNAVNPSTAPWLLHPLCFESLLPPGRAPSFPCDHCGELDRIQRGEKIDDFFGIEDLLDQAYEDAVYALIPG
jgi:hypothetical protein